MQLIQGGEPIVNYSGSIGFGRIIDGMTDVFCFLNSQDRGLGSLGGKGFKCAMRESCSPNLFDPMNPSCHTSCRNDGATGRASRGARGDNGKDGTAPTDPGTDGQIDDSYLRTSRLSENARSKYPLALLKLMKRYAEDRIWANDIEEGKSVLRFLITLMEGRKGIQAMRKDAERRLGFLDKEGFDRFGNNKLFAPLMKWERLKENAEDIEKYAKEYQDAFNRIQRSINQQEDITDILKDLAPNAARIQVSNQIKRLKTARAVDESEKRLYVESIAQVENRMSSTLETLKATLVELQAQKNMEHFFAILQGVTGFVGALIEKDPGAALGSAFSLIENEALRCNRGTLQQNKAKLEKWVRFGKAYKALADPSDLNFDEMDIQSVPEIMKADLEINKEALLADLVCLLDVDLPPQMFKELYKSYTTFSLDIDQGCKDCYNVRLLKMYVELYGAAQDQSVPDKVHLKLRPLGRSYFRIGDEIKDFHQPMASWRYLNFDRFKVTNENKCRQEKEQGKDGGFYCLTKDDKRLTGMCCHPLIAAPCDDALAGEEECRSVFGTYSLSIPIDPTLDCSAQITYKNCKNLNRELFTHMNVWTTFMYWPEAYPQTPEDCGIQKRNATVEPEVELLDSPPILRRDADADLNNNKRK
ncbi:unnamed protein product [Pocillopora meandrina]|uniref:Uncharacterized protein n=1 Tax=Pocillopora meandrina TaxID=46732 RepID=A0AAU9XEX7_9CNID|nr:unnamed protein product [Pocillopora meandrina]